MILALGKKSQAELADVSEETTKQKTKPAQTGFFYWCSFAIVPALRNYLSSGQKKARTGRAEIHFLEEMEETDSIVPKILLQRSNLFVSLCNNGFLLFEIEKPSLDQTRLSCRSTNFRALCPMPWQRRRHTLRRLASSCRCGGA